MKCSVATPEIKASVHYPVGTHIPLLIKVAFYLPLFLLLLLFFFFFLPACQVIFFSFDVYTHTNTRMYRKRVRERRRGEGGEGGGELSTCIAPHTYGKDMLVVHTGAVSLPGDKQQETQTEKEMGDGAITGSKMKTSESRVFC